MTEALVKARVIASHGRNHLVQTVSGQRLTATRKGKKGDVAVGDTVSVALGGSLGASIQTIDERKTLLFRQDAVKTKVLAANVDIMLVVFAPVPVFNPDFIWRALVAAYAGGIRPIVIRNKIDIKASQERADAFEKSLKVLGYETIAMSATEMSPEKVNELLSLIEGKTSILIGQSGMGKSTLLNRLIPQAQAKTQEISQALNAGRQTTTETRLYELDAGGAIIDSPGFTNFGLAHVAPALLQEAMPEFVPYLGHCRFADCQHTAEPGCAIKSALEAGRIACERYDFYLRTLAEIRAQTTPNY